mmetsp:Transcript_35800/g.82160  ORF Transcript_35800/g.82160 Transcript_35800/m.82160 type:complete len:287 (-) Transcript_35800:86-946(-)
MGQVEGKQQVLTPKTNFTADAFRHFREDDGTWQFRPTTVKDPYADLQANYHTPSEPARVSSRAVSGEMDHRGPQHEQSIAPPRLSGSGQSPLAMSSPYINEFGQIGGQPSTPSLRVEVVQRPSEDVSPAASRGLADELRQRTTWAEGSVLEVYSARLSTWLVGFVAQVGQPTPDMITVQFSCDGAKLLQKSLARNDMQLATFGSHLSALPPCFQSTPSKSRPGDVSYMDAETGAKFQTKDLAWQAYYEKMRQAAGYSDGPATMRPQLSQPKASAPCAVAPPEVKYF